MTPEQSAAEILIQGVARVESVKLVLLTMVFMLAISAMFALGWRWASARGRIIFYKARDAEARALIENAIDTINNMAVHGNRQQNLLMDVDDYFRRFRATFDDKERDPLAARIIELLAERRPPLQITFERREQEAV